MPLYYQEHGGYENKTKTGQKNNSVPKYTKYYPKNVIVIETTKKYPFVDASTWFIRKEGWQI